MSQVRLTRLSRVRPVSRCVATIGSGHCSRIQFSRIRRVFTSTATHSSLFAQVVIRLLDKSVVQQRSTSNVRQTESFKIHIQLVKRYLARCRSETEPAQLRRLSVMEVLYSTRAPMDTRPRTGKVIHQVANLAMSRLRRRRYLAQIL